MMTPMATPLIFGQGKGHLGARAERIAARDGAALINYTDPQCNCGRRCRPHTCPDSRRHWFTLPNTDPSITSRRAAAVMAALGRQTETA
jgi:hypothetical protein